MVGAWFFFHHIMYEVLLPAYIKLWLTSTSYLIGTVARWHKAVLFHENQ